MEDVTGIEDFELVAEVMEIAAGPDVALGGDGEVVEVFDCVEGTETDVAEMIGDDPDPFFVDLTILREGPASGTPCQKFYERGAVRDAVKLAPGLIGYLGHQQPGRRDWEYRTPQSRIIKSWLAKTEDGRMAARARAYVSRRSQDLRTHIQEKMAGPVSIDGRARLVKNKDGVRVKEMLSLRCVDWCNPGTEGSKGSGVDAVVKEMDNDARTRSKDVSEKRLTKGELGEMAEVREMIREEREAAEAPLKEQVGTLEARVSEMEAAASAKDVEIEDLKKKLEESEEAVREMRTEADRLEAEGRARDLEKYRDERIKGLEEVTDEVREMVAGRVDVEVLEDDDAEMTASKKAVDEAVEREFGEIKRVAEMFGGSLAGKPSQGGQKPAGLPPRKAKEAGRSIRDSILSGSAFAKK